MGGFQTETSHKTLSETLFGGTLKSGKGWSLFALRLAIGFMFLWGGYEKIETELGGKMATSGFLKFAVSGPFQVFFNSLAGNPVVDALVVYGELLIGISIMFGIFTRVGAISGIAMNLLFFVSQLPVQNNPIVNEYVIFMLVFLAFVFLVPGRFLGLDGLLQNSSFVERRPILRKIMATVG